MQTRLYLKAGVDLNGLTPEIVHAVAMALRVWGAYGVKRLTITSATEGEHSAYDSGHTVDFAGDEYYGYGVDFRTSDLPGGYRGAMAVRLAEMLKSMLGHGYDVILESTHIHVEFDRRSFRGGTP